MILRYTDRSKVDIDLTFEWYEKQRRGLGFEFLDCDEIVIHSVFDNRQDPKKRPK